MYIGIGCNLFLIYFVKYWKLFNIYVLSLLFVYFFREEMNNKLEYGGDFGVRYSDSMESNSL